MKMIFKMILFKKNKKKTDKPMAIEEEYYVFLIKFTKQKQIL